jgi:hypothetical protein
MAKNRKAFAKQVGGNHYNSLPIQPAEYAFYNKLPALEGAVVKYVTRHRNKGGKEDIEKAIHLLEMLLCLEYDYPEPNKLKDRLGDLYDNL